MGGAEYLLGLGSATPGNRGQPSCKSPNGGPDFLQCCLIEDQQGPLSFRYFLTTFK